MSDQTDGLTPELQNVASAIKTVGLPSSSVDRDELFYRCGWNAAMAQVADENQDLARGASVKQPASWIWPTTSGLLATAVAVLMVMLFFEADPQGGLVADAKLGDVAESSFLHPTEDQQTQGQQTEALDEPVSDQEPVINQRSVEIDLVQIVLDAPDGISLNTSLASLKRLPTNSYATRTVGGDSTGPVRRAKTNRELMSELLLDDRSYKTPFRMRRERLDVPNG